MSKIAIIAAISDNWAIGKDQNLLWHMPADMKRFKELTTGHTVIMGRKTFESLPKGALPNRKNIVLTSTPETLVTNAFACYSLEEAIQLGENQSDIFIIGGAKVYKHALSHANTLYLTFVHHTYPEADTFFPEFNADEWIEVERTDYPADNKNPFPYTFVTYTRK